MGVDLDILPTSSADRFIQNFLNSKISEMGLNFKKLFANTYLSAYYSRAWNCSSAVL